MFSINCAALPTYRSWLMFTNVNSPCCDWVMIRLTWSDSMLMASTGPCSNPYGVICSELLTHDHRCDSRNRCTWCSGSVRILIMCDITIMPRECLPGDDYRTHTHTDSKLDKMSCSQVPVGLCLRSMIRLQSLVGWDCKSVVVCPGVIL